MGQQARGRQREGRQVGEEQETGKQTGQQGLDDRRVVRQARGRKGGVSLKLYRGRKFYRPTSPVVDNLTTDLIGLSVAGQVSKKHSAHVSKVEIT